MTIANSRIFNFERPMSGAERLIASKVIRAMRDYIRPHQKILEPGEIKSAIDYCEGKAIVYDLDDLGMDGFGIQCDLMDMKRGIKPVHPLLLNEKDLIP
jgi:hypothetical protein